MLGDGKFWEKKSKAVTGTREHKNGETEIVLEREVSDILFGYIMY